MLNKLLRNLRFDWPLHFLLRLTDWLPDSVIFLRIRGKIVQPFLGSCGKNLRLGRNITFYNPASIHIGCDVYIAYGCWFMAGEIISIGDETIIGPYCVVVSSNHTRSSGSFRFSPPEMLPIKIGRGVWVASHASITAGCSVGNGTLIAAGSVVRRNIPPDSVVGGVPGRVIKRIVENE